MDDWQPIETAPKEGAEILVWCEKRWVVCAWSYSFRSDVAGWRERLASDTYEGQPLDEVGRWYARIDGDAVDDGTHEHDVIYVHPTHWMPLPQPPAPQ